MAHQVNAKVSVGDKAPDFKLPSQSGEPVSLNVHTQFRKGEVHSLRVEWPSGYERKSRLTLTTIGRRTGRRHVVNIDFVVHDGQLWGGGLEI